MISRIPLDAPRYDAVGFVVGLLGSVGAGRSLEATLN